MATACACAGGTKLRMLLVVEKHEKDKNYVTKDSETIVGRFASARSQMCHESANPV
jgi:hypothetical protein